MMRVSGQAYLGSNNAKHAAAKPAAAKQDDAKQGNAKHAAAKQGDAKQNDTAPDNAKQGDAKHNDTTKEAIEHVLEEIKKLLQVGDLVRESEEMQADIMQEMQTAVTDMTAATEKGEKAMENLLHNKHEDSETEHTEREKGSNDTNMANMSDWGKKMIKNAQQAKEKELRLSGTIARLNDVNLKISNTSKSHRENIAGMAHKLLAIIASTRTLLHENTDLTYSYATMTQNVVQSIQKLVTSGFSYAELLRRVQIQAELLDKVYNTAKQKDPRLKAKA
jgi:hypothetical protein